jgi:hypothetical protein
MPTTEGSFILRRKGLRCTRCARLGRSIWACAVCSDAADSPENKPERSDAFRIVFLSGGCRYIKTGGRCRLKLRHSRESGNLELLNFQTAFEYCRCPTFWIPATFRHSRESGNLEPLNFQITFEYCRYPKVWIPACAGMTGLL